MLKKTALFWKGGFHKVYMKNSPATNIWYYATWAHATQSIPVHKVLARCPKQSTFRAVASISLKYLHLTYTCKTLFYSVWSYCPDVQNRAPPQPQLAGSEARPRRYLRLAQGACKLHKLKFMQAIVIQETQNSRQLFIVWIFSWFV